MSAPPPPEDTLPATDEAAAAVKRTAISGEGAANADAVHTTVNDQANVLETRNHVMRDYIIKQTHRSTPTHQHAYLHAQTYTNTRAHAHTL